jgi:hypothetical protein
MALYKIDILEHILGINLIDTDWYLGLFTNAADPLVDLALSELAGTRNSIHGLMAWDGLTVKNSQSFYTGAALSGGIAEGWFIVQATASDILWHYHLITPLTLAAGESAYFPVGAISLDLTSV